MNFERKLYKFFKFVGGAASILLLISPVLLGLSLSTVAGSYIWFASMPIFAKFLVFIPISVVPVISLYGTVISAKIGNIVKNAINRLAYKLCKNYLLMSYIKLEGDIPNDLSTYEKDVKLLIENGADISMKDEEGNTLLLLACKNGKVEVVNMLIEKGIDVNVANNDGTTSLMSAISWKGIKNYDIIVNKLIEADADINVRNKVGDTPLIIACYRGNERIANKLIDLGAKIDEKNIHNDTPLSLARSRNMRSTVNKLSANKVDNEVCNGYWDTFKRAYEEENEELVRDLIKELGADFYMLLRKERNVHKSKLFVPMTDEYLKESVKKINSSICKLKEDSPLKQKIFKDLQVDIQKLKSFLNYGQEMIKYGKVSSQEFENILNKNKEKYKDILKENMKINVRTF